MITVTINNRKIAMEKPVTILEAARKAGIGIPTLCHLDSLEPFGGCRLCLVEVERVPRLQASCTQLVTDGMVVLTETERVIEARRAVIEFLLINHPLDCSYCDKSGECDLQDLAAKYGPTTGRFAEGKRKYPESFADPVIVRNNERCILCTRCVRMYGSVAEIFAEIANVSLLYRDLTIDEIKSGKSVWPYKGGPLRHDAQRVGIEVPDIAALLKRPDPDQAYAHRYAPLLYSEKSGRYSSVLEGISPEVSVKVSRTLAERLSIRDGDPVVISTDTGRVTLAAGIDPSLPRNRVLIPEQDESGTLGIIKWRINPATGTPILDGTEIRIEKAHGEKRKDERSPERGVTMEKQRVLIVDDDPVIGLSCKKVLAVEGFTVFTVEDGESAIKKVTDENFDLVITDVRLPDVNGLVVVKESRIVQPSADVVVITGYPSLEVAQESIRLGAFEYLEKPFTPDFIVNVVKKVFDRKGWILRKDYLNQFKKYIVPVSETDDKTIYYKDGTWARPLVKEEVWEIGMDVRHFLASGQLLSVEITRSLKTVLAGEPFARLISGDGRILDIKSPMSGVVKMVNERANEAISGLLKDYVSEGWLLWLARIAVTA